MVRMRAGLLTVVALFCLAGQGILLHGAGRTGDAALPWPYLFLLLTCVLAVTTALGTAWPGRRRAWRVVVLAALSVLLGLGLANMRQTGDESDVLPERAARRLDDAAVALAGLGPALDAYGDRLSDIPAAAVPAVAAGDSVFARGGGRFRALARQLETWPELHPDADNLPLRLVVWSQGHRTAWTAGAEPLPLPVQPGRTVERYRDGWAVREVLPRSDGVLLSCQVILQEEALDRRWPGLRLLAQSGTGDLDSELVRRIGLGPSGGAPHLRLGIDTSAERLQWRAAQARIYVGLVVAWIVVLAGTLGLRLGGAGTLVGLWLGRFLAAGVDLHRWLAATSASPRYPADPSSAASLVDPAYFATPFGAGWFASAADAMATGLLLLVTVWILRRQFVANAPPHGRPRLLPRRAGPRGAVFGLATGLVLAAVHVVAASVVENANARLIGHGVTVDFVSFWALHLALALLAFAPVALLTVLVTSDGERRSARVHAADGLAVALVAAATTAALGLSWGIVGLAGVLAAALWALTPALDHSVGLPRLLVWPGLLLLAAVWNYGSLHAVYDRVERGWLESKGQLVAAADPDWSRYLLGEVLVAMHEADDGGVADPASGLWQHAVAWRLWRDSALADLGLPCLVELMDADFNSESLHAVGFMGDFQYELAVRSPWSTPGKDGLLATDDLVFQTERRLYIGGEEEILVGETDRRGGGTVRAEIPLRSWRIATLLDQLTGRPRADDGGYRPRSEIDREILLLHADDTGWLAAGAADFPGPDADAPTAALRTGDRDLADVPVGGERWRCVWIPLPSGTARSSGEGFMLGLRRAGPGETLLDLSRLLLLNLGFWLAGAVLIQAMRRVRMRLAGPDSSPPWQPGFQERFLGGYLLIGLVLLLLVGGSVDRESRARIRAEARSQTRAGLEQVVDQLRSLLVEQARGLAGSEYIADLLEGQFTGRRTVGPVHLQQAMVFDADGTLLLDETLSDLTPAAAAGLLAAARRAPLVLVEDADELYLGTVIPVDLGAVLASETVGAEPRSATGFFFYRQRLDAGIVASLADLVRGELDLRVAGRMALTSAPDAVFSGRTPRLADPTMMISLLDHPAGATVLVDPLRPFAFAGFQPLPVFGSEDGGQLARRALPGILAVTFPDRERVHNDQRRQTVLFLAGLANLILLTALVLAVLLSWNVFRPLRLLLAATRSLGRGDYGAPLPEAGHDEVGRLAGAFARMRDDLATAQERVVARERFLTTVLDQVTVGVLVVDAADGLVALNPAGQDILRTFQPGADEAVAATALLDRFRDLARRTRRRGGELTGDDGGRTLRGAVAPLDLPDGRSHTMLVFEDVSEFLENQKLALNAELARQVAHEIKNPLTPIQLSAQLLRQAWRDRHPNLETIIDDAVVRILDQVELLRRIAGEFSLLGRPNGFVTEAVDLAALVAETAAAYTGHADGVAEVPGFDVAPGPVPPVLADPDSLRKVLGNLAQNSLDAATDGARVRIRVDWRIDPASVTLVWRDDGAGIPAEVAARLFDPYFSTKSKGTGLGLAICRNLVDRMGGRIALANRRDAAGAEATLTLRRADVDEDLEETP